MMPGTPSFPTQQEAAQRDLAQGGDISQDQARPPGPPSTIASAMTAIAPSVTPAAAEAADAAGADSGAGARGAGRQSRPFPRVPGKARGRARCGRGDPAAGVRPRDGPRRRPARGRIGGRLVLSAAAQRAGRPLAPRRRRAPRARGLRRRGGDDGGRRRCVARGRLRLRDGAGRHVEAGARGNHPRASISDGFPCAPTRRAPASAPTTPRSDSTARARRWAARSGAPAPRAASRRCATASATAPATRSRDDDQGLGGVSGPQGPAGMPCRYPIDEQRAIARRRFRRRRRRRHLLGRDLVGCVLPVRHPARPRRQPDVARLERHHVHVARVAGRAVRLQHRVDVAGEGGIVRRRGRRRRRVDQETGAEIRTASGAGQDGGESGREQGRSHAPTMRRPLNKQNQCFCDEIVKFFYTPTGRPARPAHTNPRQPGLGQLTRISRVRQRRPIRGRLFRRFRSTPSFTSTRLPRSNSQSPVRHPNRGLPYRSATSVSDT